MTTNNKILIIGNFGFKKNQLDGQTIKTRNIEALTKANSHLPIKRIDTSYKFNFFKLFWLLRPKTTIFFLGAKANFSFVFPYIFFINKLFGNPIIYFHIGSFLVSFLQKFPLYKFLIEYSTVHFTETEGINSALKKLVPKGNFKVLPNFRLTKHQPRYRPIRPKIRLVFFARIMQEKGVNLIFDMHEYLASYFNDAQIELDFYGPIIDKQLGFKELVDKHTGITYKGIIEPNNIYNTLEQYDLLIFPSFYMDEGFPGTILDAYISGIPVVASNWKYNAELIKDNIDGLLFTHKDSKDLAAKVEYLLKNRLLFNSMKHNAVKKGMHYLSIDYWQKIKPYVV